MKAKRYLNDIVYFLEHEMYLADTEELIDFSREWKWQEKILSDIVHTEGKDGARQFNSAIISSPRQQGKSTIAGGLGLWFLTCAGRNLNLYSFACDLSQSHIIPDRMKRAIQLNPRLRNSIKIRKDVLYCPANNNTWTCMSSDEASAPGPTADLVIFDEIGMLPEHQWSLFYTVLPTMAARPEALLVLVSTVGSAPEGPLYDFMKLVEEGKDEHCYLFYTDKTLSPLTSERQRARDKALMPEPVFRRFWENTITLGGAFLSDDEIENIITAEDHPLAANLSSFVGCDFGLTRDKCALVKLVQHGNLFLWGKAVVYQGSRRNPVDLTLVMDDIFNLHDSSTMKIVLDKWQAALAIQQMQQSLGADRVMGYDFSSASRKRLFQLLFQVIRTGALKIRSKILKGCWRQSCSTCGSSLSCGEQPQHDFLRELSGLQVDAAFNVSHSKHGDDICVATALALQAAAQDQPQTHEIYSTSSHLSYDDIEELCRRQNALEERRGFIVR